MNYVSLLIGSIIGAVLSFFATEISAIRRRNEDKEKYNKNTTNEIIGNCLSHLFKYKDGLNDIATKKGAYLELRSKYPDKALQMEKEIHQAAYDQANSGIFHELMINSYQLKRTGDPTLWKEFEELINLHEGMTNILIRDDDNDFKKYSESEDIYKKKLRSFVDKCFSITRVSSPG
jgi:hypothetical protein